MLGYVTTEKPELKLKEFELYSGYYCGVCKSISRRHGQIPRFVLSYDAAFLGMVMAGVNGDENQISREHCIIHPISEKTIVRNEGIDYAADVMLILAWFNLLDDARDEGKLYAKAATSMLRNKFRKLSKKYPDLVKEIDLRISELAVLEKDRCSNMDQVSETFAKIMQAVFTGDGRQRTEEANRKLSDLGYHMGKWIYLMDAWDDVIEDIANKVYNPLIYRHDYREEEGYEGFRDRIRGNVEFNLFMYLDQMGRAADVLETGENSSIIDNIVHMGLLRQTEKILRRGLPKEQIEAGSNKTSQTEKETRNNE